jgi:hypothetical protein
VLKDVSVDDRIILKWIFKEAGYAYVAWIQPFQDSVQLGGGGVHVFHGVGSLGLLGMNPGSSS